MTRDPRSVGGEAELDLIGVPSDPPRRSTGVAKSGATPEAPADRAARLALDLARAVKRIAELEAAEGRVRAPIYDPENGGSFEGFDGGPEHRTVGDYRAWSYDYSEWCYPRMPCRGCMPPIEVADLREALDGLPDDQQDRKVPT